MEMLIHGCCCGIQLRLMSTLCYNVFQVSYTVFTETTNYARFFATYYKSRVSPRLSVLQDEGERNYYKRTKFLDLH